MMEVWDQLLTLNFSPFCPLWSHFQHTFRPRPYQDWVQYDLEWVAACDVLLRLPGTSRGADGEVDEARRLGIPVVVGGVTELTQWRRYHIAAQSELLSRGAERGAS